MAEAPNNTPHDQALEAKGTIKKPDLPTESEGMSEQQLHDIQERMDELDAETERDMASNEEEMEAPLEELSLQGLVDNFNSTFNENVKDDIWDVILEKGYGDQVEQVKVGLSSAKLRIKNPENSKG